MKKEINLNFCVIYYIKTMETFLSVARKILRTKIQVVKKLNKIE